MILPEIEPHTGRILQNRIFPRDIHVYYHDLNDQPPKEQIVLDNYNNLDRPMIKVANTVNNNYQGIWNLEGKYMKDAPLLFGDYNKDGHQEIYTFDRFGDSIYVHGIDYRQPGKTFLSHQFVAKTQLYGDGIDLQIDPVGQQDMNGDGFREIYFAIDAGFSMRPRGIFALDVKNRKIIRSPKAGMRFPKSTIIMEDINQDGAKEIITSVHASDNYADTSNFPYNDNHCWLMAFDKNLNFLFEPVKFEGAPSQLRVYPYQHQGKYYIATLFYTLQKNRSKKFNLSLFSIRGKKITERYLINLPKLDSSSHFAHYFNRKHWDELYIASRKGQILYFDDQLRLIDQKNLDLLKCPALYYLNLDTNATRQEILVPNEKGFLITNHQLEKDLLINDAQNISGIYDLSVYHKNEKQIIHAQAGKEWYELSYYPNRLYQYRWGIPVLIFLTVWRFLKLRKKTIRKRKRKAIIKKLRSQEAEKKRLAKELHDEVGNKLTGLRLQVENLKEEEHRDSLNELIDYIHQTHKEIRHIIHNQTPPRFRDQELAPILEELLHEYDKYSGLNVDFDTTGVDNWNGSLTEDVKFHTYRIVQEAMTNIIKHAGAEKAWVRLKKDKNNLVLHIEDNGEGFDKRSMETASNGLGMENIRLRTELMNGFMDMKTNREGTSLLIRIPIHPSQGL
jgi:signal transduction histidine kinase